ncbi:DUF488 family protein [Lysobacter korlensis]|uniref:DUF488 family protein n=1 Tax=Lysobacter korlensis TaxID=553636 RepID=A0ABV6RXJ5_9GAMM
MAGEVCTVGHSTRPIEEFLAILHAHQVREIVDVRTIPKSRTNPQFGGDSLRKSLAADGIAYRHVPSLGGLRRPRKDSPNDGWRNTSFRGYADHMATEEFAQGIDELLDAAAVHRVAVMCAEAVPWRCHRSLIGDAVLVRGVPVLDLMDATTARPHVLTRFACVEGSEITYPAEEDDRTTLW